MPAVWILAECSLDDPVPLLDGGVIEQIVCPLAMLPFALSSSV